MYINILSIMTFLFCAINSFHQNLETTHSINGFHEKVDSTVVNKVNHYNIPVLGLWLTQNCIVNL